MFYMFSSFMDVFVVWGLCLEHHPYNNNDDDDGGGVFCMRLFNKLPAFI